VPITARYRVSESEGETSAVNIYDISWGGVHAVIDPPLPEGTRIIIEFSLLEDDVSLELWGTVVRIEEGGDGTPRGVGVQFDPLDDDSRSLIQRLVREGVTALIKKT